jgi:predicted ATPase/class 3 adenylate cyclase
LTGGKRGPRQFSLLDTASAYPAGVSVAAAIPSGTVTLLFTDIEGSTRLWDSERAEMAVALRRHDAILREAISRAGGFVFKTVGDEFCAAFRTPLAAVSAALDAQRALAAEVWPTSRPVLVRMGLHTGACEERDNDYFGPPVNRTARLEAIAHGGQVLLSGATAGLVADGLPSGVALRDMGQHRLKDLGRPEQVFQLEAAFLTAKFPQLASLDNPELPNNLPVLISPFIGRDPELAEVRDLLRASRLLTLSGAGGSGKTRLALQAAAEMLGVRRDGVWFVELAPLTEPDQVPAAVAAVLGLPDPGSLQVADAVIGALGCQDALIILDNCEHLIDAAAKFCDTGIRHCPKIRFMATSREPLGIDGEWVYRVPSMSLPPDDAASADDVARSDAVRLFADRARLSDPTFALDDSTAMLLASTCRRLDGIPLALELAAARLTSMSLQQVNHRLDHRFRLLTGGSRNAVPRQQTLQATVDWSFGLLTAQEQQTLVRLSVFAGGFELEAAETVCATEKVDAWDVADLVGSLVDKSLVLADHRPGSVRYRMLETIRQYAGQKLLRSGGDAERVALSEKHADYYLHLATAAEPELKGHDQGQWLRDLDAEWDNLRAALAFLAADNRDDDVLALAVALTRLAITRGHPEVLSCLRRAVEQADQTPRSVLAAALASAAIITMNLFLKKPGERAASLQYARRALEMARAIGDQRQTALALAVVAEGTRRGDIGSASVLAQEAVAIARQLGDAQLLGEVLEASAFAAPEEQKRATYLEALSCVQQCGDHLTAASAQHRLFGMDLHAGRIKDARLHAEEAVALAERGVGGDFFLYWMRTDLSNVLLIDGDPGQAEAVVRQCLLVVRRLGFDADASQLLVGAACCATWRGDYENAARLHGAANADIKAALEAGAINWSEAERNLQEKDRAKLREILGERAYEDAYREGAQLSPEKAVELALGRTWTA